MKMGYRTTVLTFKDVLILSQKIAVFLENKGLKKGAKVLILAPNSPHWICIFWACLLKGYIIVPLNLQSTPQVIRKIAKQTNAKVIFKFLHYTHDLPSNLKCFNIEFIKELVDEIDISDFKKERLNENDVMELLYTSGTTGDPKGVILTHKNIYSNLKGVEQIMPIPSSDKFLSILPLSHIYEQTIGFLVPFYRGQVLVGFAALFKGSVPWLAIVVSIMSILITIAREILVIWRF